MKINCPNCMASLVYDASLGKMTCKFCGHLFEPENVAFGKAKETANAETMECNIYACTACGAELSINGVETATFCAYCGQPTIVFSRVSRERKPKWIIPFKVPKEDAVEDIRARFRQGLFVPKAVKNFEVDRVSGIYIPYWLYDTFYHDMQIIKGVVGRGKFAHDKFFKREGDCEFTKLSVDASAMLSDESAQRLEPFDMGELKLFDTAYMSGYYADMFDASSFDLEENANLRTKELFDAQMLASVKANGCKMEFNNPTFEVRASEYALLPAWFMTFRYKDKPYTMLVNGQTGKLVGTPPIDRKKVLGTAFGLFLVASCALVPVYMTISSLLMSSSRPEKEELFFYIIYGSVVAAILMIGVGIRRLRGIRFNKSLTTAADINRFAHERQQQQGGIYE